jgi:hypothetical protein
VDTLRGILPLCSFCKKVRDDKGYWEQVDVYISKHSQADFSHSVCPECMEKYYPDQEGGGGTLMRPIAEEFLCKENDDGS